MESAGTTPGSGRHPGKVTHGMFELRALVFLMISLLAGIAAGWLTVQSGQPPAAGVLAGGGAFAATMLFLDKVIR
ncbi:MULTISPECIES: hypothetical protein [unclassified Nocardia]|uniref:hypothetical protein n=1 Tax=unclassified Nocardia TaxID=2637762 RepID=UPI001CE48ACA|nr:MULTISPECIES: hypothetical protein [unclassified Nocardia]